MNFKDVTSLTQNAVAETLGTTFMEKSGDISAMDSYSLVDVGKSVLTSGCVDKYVKSLLTQMGKMVITAKRYTAELPSLFIDSFDWGGYIERVYYLPQDLIQDEMYNLVDGTTYEDHKFYQPKTTAKIFEEAKTIMSPISITQDQIKEAFSGWDEMNAFLSGIHTNVQNTITLALEAYAHMLISCGIAVSFSGTHTAIHLLTEAIAEGIVETGTTAEEAMTNAEFLKFANYRISEIRDNMRRYCTAFNDGSYPTFTDETDSRLALLTKFVKKTKFFVKAGTFNVDEIGVGTYDTVSSWQAFKAESSPNFDFATCSKVMISADSNNKLGCGVSAITIPNVIGICYDTRAMGICPHKSKVTSNYTAVADFWNEYYHQLFNYILDNKFNIVAFVVD